MSDERFVHAWLLRLDPAWRRRAAEERRAMSTRSVRPPVAPRSG